MEVGGVTAVLFLQNQVPHFRCAEVPICRGDIVLLAPPPLEFAERADGKKLAFQRAGTGPPEIVFVAGAQAMSQAWKDPATARPLRRLASFSRFVTYDQLGMGRSDRMELSSSPTIDDLVDDLETVIAASGVRDPVLFGTHNGGAVTAVYATRHPVDRLVLCNSWARLEWAPDFQIGFPSGVLDRMEKRYRTQWGQGLIFDQFARRSDYAPAVEAELEATTQDQLPALFNINRTYDIRAVLPEISARTLVLHTEDNFMIPPVHGRFLADAIPNARLLLVPGSDQQFLRNYADPVIDEVQRFVTGVCTPFTDSVRATMTYTDIVKSTETASSMGNKEWNETIRAHNALMRRLIVSHGGEECKHTGDGLLVAFEDVPDAVRFALDAVGEATSLGLEVSAGVHVGEVARMDGSDLSGVEVHFAQRLCDRAEGDQVLVSEDVRDGCEGRGLTFENRGRVTFKGLGGKWQIYEAVP
jgi:pimeloyl-ACP methyl ester carboxylesterase